MKEIIICIVAGVLCLLVPFAHAEEPKPTEAPTKQVTVEWMNQFESERNPSLVISTIHSLLNGFDSFLGGIVFQTPNVMGDPIKAVKSQSGCAGSNCNNVLFSINDISKIRAKLFYWSIPLLAIVLAGIALAKTTETSVDGWKAFLGRVAIVVVLYITTPYILMYTIQFSNMLTAEFTKEQTVTQFLKDAYTKAGERAGSVNEDAQFAETGIPTFKFSLTGGLLKGMGDFITKAFVFLLMVAAMFIGLIALAFQFTFRILALITLSILFPFAIPFALSEKTQGMVESFFKLWFSYLLQQPAFALGYAIVIAIARSTLEQGFNIGLMFFFTASLFFLTVVNDLVSRIFGDPWTAMANSLKAAFAGGMIGGAIGGSIGKVKEGAVGGRISGIRSYIGNRIGQKYGMFPRTDASEVTTNRMGYKTQWINGQPTTVQTQDSETVTRVSSNRSRKPFDKRQYQNDIPTSAPPVNNRAVGMDYSGEVTQSFNSSGNASQSSDVKPRYTFTNDFAKKGWETSVDDEKLGIVKMSGDAYSYRDKATGLTSIYSSKQDAIKDGVLETDLKPYNVQGERYIDLSTFGKNRKNPHNSYATSVARKRGFKSEYAHIKHSSDPERIKRFFEMTNSRNKKLGVDGVIVRRWGNVGDTKTTDKVIRIYTNKKI